MKNQDAAAIHAQRVLEATLNEIYKDAEKTTGKKLLFDLPTLLAAIAIVVLISAVTAMAVYGVVKP